MDNKTPLAIGIYAYAIKQSIRNHTVKTKYKNLKTSF